MNMESVNGSSQSAHQLDCAAQPTFTNPYPPLTEVTKPGLTTNEAAYYTDRRPQTLRIWACKEDGPIRPRRVNGRLSWPTAEVKSLLGVA